MLKKTVDSCTGERSRTSALSFGLQSNDNVTNPSISESYDQHCCQFSSIGFSLTLLLPSSNDVKLDEEDPI